MAKNMASISFSYVESINRLNDGLASTPPPLPFGRVALDYKVMVEVRVRAQSYDAFVQHFLDLSLYLIVLME